MEELGRGNHQRPGIAGSLFTLLQQTDSAEVRDSSAGHGLQRRVKYPGGSVAEFARIRGLGRERSPRILANSATTSANHVLHPRVSLVSSVKWVTGGGVGKLPCRRRTAIPLLFPCVNLGSRRSALSVRCAARTGRFVHMAETVTSAVGDACAGSLPGDQWYNREMNHGHRCNVASCLDCAGQP